MGRDDRPDQRNRYPKVIADCQGCSVGEDQLLHLTISAKELSGPKRGDVPLYLGPDVIAGGRERINAAVAAAIGKNWYYISHRVHGLVDSKSKRPVQSV